MKEGKYKLEIDTFSKKKYNITSYRFVNLAEDRVEELLTQMKRKSKAVGLKGTILLSSEGINVAIAGSEVAISNFWTFLTSFNEFADMTYKASLSKSVPFKRLFVKKRKEMISLGNGDISPKRFKGRKVSPKELKKWFDENLNVVLLDARNRFEVEFGSFANAIHCDIDSFRDFATAVDNLQPGLKERPVVTFCTGGIRCEKAAPLLEKKGFKEVYQLDGGILKYFEEVGAEHYKGECFVFDERVSLDSQLVVSGTIQCKVCSGPVTPAEQKSRHYIPGASCPHCKDRRS